MATYTFTFLFLFGSQAIAQNTSHLAILKSTISDHQNGADQCVYFKPVGHSVIASVRAREIAKSPEDQRKLEKVFTEYINAYTGDNHGQPIDLCSVTTIFLIDQYQLSKDIKLTQKSIEQVYVQVIIKMVTSPNFKALNDLQKQEIYESLIIEMCIIHLQFEDGNINDQQKENLRKRAGRNLEFLLSAPVDKIAVSENGLLVDTPPKKEGQSKTAQKAQMNAEAYRIQSQILQMEHETKMGIIRNMDPYHKYYYINK
jgi:hypothetical protein